MIVDSVIAGITERFDAINKLNDTFSVLWKFGTLKETGIKAVKKYNADVSPDFKYEINHLKNIYKANFKAN